MSAEEGYRRLRSLLFTPASDVNKLAHAGQHGADAIVLDLEDAVAASAKARARVHAADHVSRVRHEGLTMVRVNAVATEYVEADLEAVVVRGLDAVVVPKVEGPDDIAYVEQLLDRYEQAHGLRAGSVKVLALVETARGIADVNRIAGSRSPRLQTLILGTGDLTTELDLQPLEDGAELTVARSCVVVACRANGLAAPLDGPYLAFRDLEGLALQSNRSRAFGFGGRVVVHPAQVPVVHDAYRGSPSADAHRLEAIIDAFEAAERRGVAAIEVAGTFVDYPIYRQARHALRRHEEPLR